jgi:hypothetical protein
MVLLVSIGPAAAQENLDGCQDLAFSTEEDFITQGPLPPDGNPILSDGDLLGVQQDVSGDICVVCARNGELLTGFDVVEDLGLDAVDVIDVAARWVAFSTELDSPNAGQFTSGDLLATNNTIIPNLALTDLFSVGYDVGLDSVHFVGEIENIIAFLDYASQLSREDWLVPATLSSQLQRFEVDIWFSTEEAFGPVSAPTFLEGDLLSARDGIVVAANDALRPPSVPAGIPSRGVDLGLDAVTAGRDSERAEIRFSSEISFDGDTSLTDGDVLKHGVGVEAPHVSLIGCFEARADFVGLDALHKDIAPTPP